MNQPARCPLLIILFAFISGIVSSQYIAISFFSPVIAFIVLFVLIVKFFYHPMITWLLLLFSFLCLGNLYTQSTEYIGKEHIVHTARYYRSQPVAVKGIVVSDITKKNAFNGIKTSFDLELVSLKTPWGWRKKKGKILVNIFRDVTVTYGDLINVEGKLHRPYNFSADSHFSYRRYLKHKGIHFILSAKKTSPLSIDERHQGDIFHAASYRLRNRGKEMFSEYLTDNEAGIMRAIVLGDRTNIPKHVRELFVRTGTAHILAISGLHIGIVAGIFFVFLRLFPIGRQWQLLITIVLLVFYMFLTGARPSVVRATIMTIIFLSSYVVERETNIFNTLSLAAIAILLVNPLNLFDVGFQLSFACVVAIVMLDRIVLRLLLAFFGHQNAVVYFFCESLSVSIAVWLGVVGLIAYYFQIITPITIVANLFVVPLISVVVALGFGLLAFGAVVPIMVGPFVGCIKLALNLMVGLIYLFDKVPYAYIFIKDINPLITTVYYTALFMIFCLTRRDIPLKLKKMS